MTQQNHFDESINKSDNPLAMRTADHALRPFDTPALPPAQPTRTSVDTLRFRGEFEIVGELSPDFIVEHSRDPLRDICLYVEQDEAHFLGKRAKAQRCGIYACIEPVYENSQESICTVSFSAPRVLYGSNEHVLSAEECERAIEIVEQTLLAWGIRMNVRGAKLTRIDVLRHLEMNRPATCHVNVLHFLTIKHSRYTLNYPTGILRGNKSAQLCIYDKGAQMKSEQISPIEVVPLSPRHMGQLAKLHEETILRVEWRLRRAEPIRKELKLSSICDLLAKFDSLDSWLTRKLKANLFREKVPYPVEEFVGKPPSDNPTFQQRSTFLAQMLGGTSSAVRQALFFEAFERRMRLRHRRCLPDLRKMHKSSRGGDEFAKLQKEIRETMLWGLSLDGIRNAVLYEELRRAVETPIGEDWTQSHSRRRRAQKRRRARRRQTPAPKCPHRRR